VQQDYVNDKHLNFLELFFQQLNTMCSSLVTTTTTTKEAICHATVADSSEQMATNYCALQI